MEGGEREGSSGKSPAAERHISADRLSDGLKNVFNEQTNQDGGENKETLC